ncbi:MAG: hypothetical protein HY438_02810 [DPANN group archaeon]|nr:hypothetical protein [DPANN group archaeon]
MARRLGKIKLTAGSFRSHHHLPALAFGLAAVPITLYGLLQNNFWFMGSLLVMFAATATTIGIVQHWRWN